MVCLGVCMKLTIVLTMQQGSRAPMKLTLAIQVRVPGSSQPKLDQGSVSCKKTQIRFLFDLKISALLSSSSESAYYHPSSFFVAPIQTLPCFIHTNIIFVFWWSQLKLEVGAPRRRGMGEQSPGHCLPGAVPLLAMRALRHVRHPQSTLTRT